MAAILGPAVMLNNSAQASKDAAQQKYMFVAERKLRSLEKSSLDGNGQLFFDARTNHGEFHTSRPAIRTFMPDSDPSNAIRYDGETYDIDLNAGTICTLPARTQCHDIAAERDPVVRAAVRQVQRASLGG